jgi:hypothetical protein
MTAQLQLLLHRPLLTGRFLIDFDFPLSAWMHLKAGEQGRVPNGARRSTHKRRCHACHLPVSITGARSRLRHVTAAADAWHQYPTIEVGHELGDRNGTGREAWSDSLSALS